MDVRQIPYRTMFEVRCSNVPALNRALKDTGWSASPSPDDCSHQSEGLRTAGGYAHINGPVTTLEAGGAASLADILAKVKSVVPDAGKTAAMRIYVPETAMDSAAATRLANFHLANESILYHLGASGGAGRALTDKATWCCPLSKGSNYIPNQSRTQLFSPSDAPQLRNQLSNKHWGMNASTLGQWEFRYFDTSYNVAGMQASHDMVLGMVNAAVDGTATADCVRPLDVSKHCIDQSQWDSFTAVVSPDGVLRDQLLANLQASGATTTASVPTVASVVTAVSTASTRGVRLLPVGLLLVSAASLTTSVLMGLHDPASLSLAAEGVLTGLTGLHQALWRR